MSELFDKEVNVQKESLKKTSVVHASSRKLPQAHEKCAMKMKQRNKKKRRAPKIFFDGRKEFIRCVPKTDVMDI